MEDYNVRMLAVTVEFVEMPEEIEYTTEFSSLLYLAILALFV